ncbi:MAG: histidinol dehydrogenase [Solirubrobacteraceae bacterium]
MASEPTLGDRWASIVAAELRSLTPAPESISRAVAEIVARVRREGDAAVADYTEKFDTAGHPAPPLRVTEEELSAAEETLDAAVSDALRAAFRNVYEVAQAGISEPQAVADATREIVLREAPVQRAAVYAPGGRAPYPSTVVMGVAAAKAAGVTEVVVCSPPEVDPAILAACRLTGASEMYRMGGAQAIAALAYGTETVRPADVIVGPGNLYVQEAKRQVSDRVAIDGFAGPSDLMVIVEEDVSDLNAIVLDLLAQAEHGAGTVVVAVSTSPVVVEQLTGALTGAQTDAVIRLEHAPTLEEALELAEAFAPEHLQLAGASAEALAPRVTKAGCLFVGADTGTAFGDYIVGSNHILPTNGSARFTSGLSAAQFRRRFAEVRILEAAPLARRAAPLARAEGFELHAQSMEARIRDNRDQ